MRAARLGDRFAGVLQIQPILGTTLTDATSNGNHGTLNNFALTGTTSNWVSSGGVNTGTSCYNTSITVANNCGSTTLTASTGNSYLWSNGASTNPITVTSNGTYSVTVTGAGGVTSSASHVVSILTPPVFGFSGSATGCGEVTLTATPAGQTNYLWSNNATTATTTFTSSGTYTVTVTGTGGCTSTASQAVIVFMNTYYPDADGDNFGDDNTQTEGCVQPADYVTDNTDCNDADPAIHPGASETCDDIDNNCNGILIEQPCPDNPAAEVSVNCRSVSSENVLNGEVFFNYGSASNALNPATRSSFTVGQPVVGTNFGTETNTGFGFWTRFLLSPSAPSVAATEGDLPDRVQISWRPDPLSPAAVSYKLYRDGALLATMDGETFSFLDFNVLAGQFYTYEVAGVNEFGEGYRGSSLGFMNPNGVVTGQVKTFSNNPVVGAVVTLSPTIGTALEFDELGSAFVEYDTAFPSNAFTISAWVKLGEGNDEAGIFDLGSHVGKNWWLHTLPGGVKGVKIGIGGGVGNLTELDYTFPAATANDWHNISTSYNGSSLLLYVDGELIETAVGSMQADSLILYLGQRTDGNGRFIGKLDELRFFNRQLPQTEIQMLMNKTASASTPGLVAYWKFDEGVGSKGFDLSDTKAKAYLCGASWSQDKPSVVNAGISDETGFYKIEGVNYAAGTTFTAIPSKNFYFNQSLEFNAANLSYADLTDFDLADSASLTLTVKAFDFSGNQAILSKANAGGSNLFSIGLNNGNLEMTVGSEMHDFGALGMGFHYLAFTMVQTGSSLAIDFYKNGTATG